MSYEFTEKSKAILDNDECFYLICDARDKINNGKGYQDLIDLICEKSGCTEAEANMAIEEHICRMNQYIKEADLNKPHCPTCNSTKIHKISGLSKAGSVAMWGIFSQKVKKQFHCDNCGYEW